MPSGVAMGEPREHARAPGLLPQPFGKYRREVLQFVDVIWIAHKRERQLSRLLEITIVDLEPLHR